MTGAEPAPPGWVALVAATTTGGTGSHVRMLAAGLAGRDVGVTVLAPASVGGQFGIAALPGVTFRPAEFGGLPRPRDAAAILRLRRALARVRDEARDAAHAHGVSRADGVVHAHGVRAGALAVLALAGMRARPALVVTVHNAPPSGGGAAVLIYRILERVLARGTDLVLCVSPDLEARMRAIGARDVRRAVVAAPEQRPASPSGVRSAGVSRASGSPSGVPAGRPVVLAVGRLAAQKGFGTLLEAAASWRDLDPPPVVVLAGEGPLAGKLRARAAALGVDAVFPGQVADVSALLEAAAVLAVPSMWEGQPLVVQEGLRAGAAIVATRAGGIPGLTGADAAVLVPPGDPVRLAAAVRALLTDPGRADRLRAAARRRAAALPAEADAVAAALAGYEAVLRARAGRSRRLRRGSFALLAAYSGAFRAIDPHEKPGPVPSRGVRAQRHRRRDANQ